NPEKRGWSFCSASFHFSPIGICIINTLRKSNSDLVDLTCKRSGVIDHDKFIKMLYIGDYLVYNIVCV
ncbi:TPA: hypothetical protein ACT2IH_001895, partial [Streptococcus suis]